jgi:hypothetical protein
MRAVEDSNDAAFGALRSGAATRAALDFCKDVVTVHGIFDGVARNEDVAIELRHRNIRDDKAVAVVVEDQAALNFIKTRQRRTLGLRGLAGTRRLARGFAILFAARETVATAGQFLDGVALLEFREHFEEGAAVGLLQVETL